MTRDARKNRRAQLRYTKKRIDKTLGKNLPDWIAESIVQSIKPKPRLLPVWIWRVVVRRVFDAQLLKKGGADEG